MVIKSAVQLTLMLLVVESIGRLFVMLKEYPSLVPSMKFN